MVGVSGRSLSLIDLLGELRTCDIDFYLHQQATPSGRPARWAFKRMFCSGGPSGEPQISSDYVLKPAVQRPRTQS